MEANNICKFIPSYTTSDPIRTINFVYEANVMYHNKFIVNSVFILYLVTSGIGILHTTSGSYELKTGDLFFSFPSTPFSVENKQDFTYLYISYLGIRVNELYARLGITKNKPFYAGYTGLIPFWQHALEEATIHNIDIKAESVLLYTFSCIHNISTTDKDLAKSTGTILTIKKHMDDHFSDPDMNLRSISKRFIYDTKYLSRAFKQKTGVDFIKYLTAIRMQNAHGLIEQGFTSVKEISCLSGYKDAMYFSKVFKKHYGSSPTAYISHYKNK